MTKISAFFFGEPGGLRDKSARAVFESHGGTFIGAGSWMIGPSAGERDVEYDVPDSEVDVVKALLLNAGYRLSPTPI